MLKTVAEKEGLQLSSAAADSIVGVAGGDLRNALQTMQMLYQARRHAAGGSGSGGGKRGTTAAAGPSKGSQKVTHNSVCFPRGTSAMGRCYTSSSETYRMLTAQHLHRPLFPTHGLLPLPCAASPPLSSSPGPLQALRGRCR